ncbi:MAG: SCO family protein [Caldilinea sp.]|jgi:protein SCO1/2
MQNPIGVRCMACCLLLILLLAGCGEEYQLRGTRYDPILPAPPLVGTNLDNTPFVLSELPEAAKVVSFGYTFCPDVCPLTLSNLKGVYDALDEQDRGRVAFVFVSVDPERDTPERLASYVKAFHPTFYGVHIENDALTAVKQGYGVFAEKRVLETSQSAADYLVDHTAFLYVIDAQNNLREIFAHDAPIEDIAADLAYLVHR